LLEKLKVDFSNKLRLSLNTYFGTLSSFVPNSGQEEQTRHLCAGVM